MKEVEQYLCAECWQSAAAAMLEIEQIQQQDAERRTCAWCGRSCFGGLYHITYGRTEHEQNQ